MSKPYGGLQAGTTRRGGLAAGATRAGGGGLAANSTRRTGGRYGTSRRNTHGTTTGSNAEVDHDYTTIDGKRIYIKPKSLYPDRDDGREKQPGEDGEDRSKSRTKRKFKI